MGEENLLNFLKNFNYEDTCFFYSLLDKILSYLKINEPSNKVYFGFDKPLKKLIFTIGKNNVLYLYSNKDFIIGVITNKEPIVRNYRGLKSPKNCFFNLISDSDKKKVISNLPLIIEGTKILWEKSKSSQYSKYNDEYFVKSVFDINYRNQIFNKVFNKTFYNYFGKKFYNNLREITEMTYDKNSSQQVNLNFLNTILYGPPGTGKTYNVINKALEIIMEKEPDEEINDLLKKQEMKYYLLMKEKN